jgi:hypothetical protein
MLPPPLSFVFYFPCRLALARRAHVHQCMAVITGALISAGGREYSKYAINRISLI